MRPTVASVSSLTLVSVQKGGLASAVDPLVEAVDPDRSAACKSVVEVDGAVTTIMLPCMRWKSRWASTAIKERAQHIFMCHSYAAAICALTDTRIEPQKSLPFETIVKGGQIAASARARRP